MIIKLPFIPFLSISAITLSPNLIIANKFDIDNSEWLLQHEQIHQEQMRRIGTLTFHWRYITNSKFRLVYEIEAYHDSYKRLPSNLYNFARSLCDSYWLSVSMEDAMDMITTGIIKQNYL